MTLFSLKIKGYKNKAEAKKLLGHQFYIKLKLSTTGVQPNVL